MITVQGLIPYPPMADSRPIQQLAADLKQLSAGLNQSSTKLSGTASAASSTWVGQAASAFASHTNERARTVAAVGQTLGQAVPVLQTFAAAIEATSAAYTTAAVAENIARAGLPWTAAAVAAAITAEGAAVAALQAAGIACAGALLVIELELAAAQFLGVNRDTFTAIKETATSIWDGIVEAGTDMDADAAVRLLNTTITLPNGNGTSTRTSALGWLIDSNPRFAAAVGGIQAMLGVGVLLTAPPMQAVERPDLAGTVTQGMTGAPNAAQLGQLMSNLEDLRRAPGAEADQSVSLLVTRGTAPDGTAVMNVVVPGMVPPGDGLYASSGTRNLPNATSSQITGLGTEEVAMRNWITSQGLKPGDTVNLMAHSQGGIVSRNVANDLITRGYRVNVVSYGSPDGQFRPGVGAYVVQNLRDPVPAARIGGDGGQTTTLHPGQHLVTFDHEVDGDLFNSHDARIYGQQMMQRGGTHSGAAELNGFLRGQQAVTIDPSRTTVVTLEGPCTPQGVCDGVPQPSSAYQLGSRK
jgi:uncharacterized protein YukE